MPFDPAENVGPMNWPPPRMLTELNERDQRRYYTAYHHVKKIEMVHERMRGYVTGRKIEFERWELILGDYEQNYGPVGMASRSFQSSYSREKKTLMDLVKLHNEKC